MILFDPRVFFKTKKARRTAIEALAVWNLVSNQKSPKEIEATHGLRRHSFLAYVKWKDEPEPELPQTIRKLQIKLQKQILCDGGAAAKPQFLLQLAPNLLPAAVPIDAAAAVSEKGGRGRFLTIVTLAPPPSPPSWLQPIPPHTRAFTPPLPPSFYNSARPTINTPPPLPPIAQGRALAANCG